MAKINISKAILNFKRILYPLREELSFLTSKFKKSKYDSKVFCIGYNKTGTTSLGKALILLGYDHSTFNRIIWRRYYQKGKIKSVIDYTSKFESFDDLPWLKEDMIPILDKKFPGSKFIYLEREEKAWKNSFYNWTFKVTGKYPDKEEGWDNYLKHKRFVDTYFKNRENTFITLSISDPNGFKKLSSFLEKDYVQDSFFVFNKT